MGDRLLIFIYSNLIYVQWLMVDVYCGLQTAAWLTVIRFAHETSNRYPQYLMNQWIIIHNIRHYDYCNLVNDKSSVPLWINHMGTN